MQKPADLIIEDFKEGLQDYINSNQHLPMSVIVMIVNEIHANINKQYSQYLRQLREEYTQESERIPQESFPNDEIPTE